MNEVKQNKKRKLVEEYGPYMNKRWTVYDNKGTMEVWFSDKQKALEWWETNKDRETYSEKREKQRKEDAKRYAELPDLDTTELPFY